MASGNGIQQQDYPFLQGGGEMGALTRAFDWSGTAIGAPDTWPQSLRTTLSILLSSRFPMFLFWGPELICFYNDAYRPSLGNSGKHPTALGQRGEDCWPEIWQDIRPLIDQVKAGGEATWAEDLLLPIYRNGGLEDVYWTFSYSPVKDEAGNISGVLVVCSETTEKVNSMARLSEQEEQLRFAIEAAELGTWDLNPATGKFTGNSRLKGWFGLPADSEIPLTLAIEAIAKDDHERVTAAIQRVMEYSSGGNYDIEYAIISPATGEERIVRAKGRAWFDDERQPYRFNGTLQDITEQTNGRRMQEESEARFRNLIEEAPIASCLFAGKDMVVEIANSAMLSYWGKGRSVIGKPLREAVPELVGQPFLDILDEVFTTGVTCNAQDARAELIVDGVPGTYYFDFTYNAVRDEHGNIYGVMDTAVDVTEKVLARLKLEESEAALRATAERLTLALDAGNFGSYEVDFTTGRISGTPQCKAIFGLAMDDDLTVERLDSMILPEDREGRVQALAAAIKARSPYTAEYRIQPLDGEVVRWMRSAGNLVYDEAGNAVKLVGIIMDITAQKAFTEALTLQVQTRTEELAATNEELQSTNEELFETNEQLVHSNEELAQYAYVASHDLQEPLRKIRLFSNMLDSKAVLPDDQKLWVQKINQASGRMTGLIRDLLDFSRLLKSDTLMAPVNLATVFTAVITDFELTIEEKQATVNIGALPVIEAVGLQVNQLFYNLISNALKFTTPERAPVLKISAELLPPEAVRQYIQKPLPFSDYFRITFADNGIGFEPKFSEQIFEVFKRLHGREIYPGSGVGLALCRRIVANHNGYLYVESEPGKGSSFHIILPQKQHDAASIIPQGFTWKN